MSSAWGELLLYPWGTPLIPLSSLNIHSVHGPVVNSFEPWPQEEEALGEQESWVHRGKRFSAGGSSGGSAAAVAAGMCRA